MPLGTWPDGEPIVGCPRRQTDPDAAAYLALFSHFRDGRLWCAGGLGDQPARYLAAMDVIADTLATIERGGTTRTADDTLPEGGLPMLGAPVAATPAPETAQTVLGKLNFSGLRNQPRKLGR